MNILFIHQNFPGQFIHLAPALAAIDGNRVDVLTLRQIDSPRWKGVNWHTYKLERGSTRGLHPWLTDLESKVIRGEACFRAALALKESGYSPDVIVAHPGWGESLYLKEVWPEARLGIYCEFFYLPEGADTGFDPEFENHDEGNPCRLRMKNANNILHFDRADAAISPTHWQASTFPENFRPKISVIHDGIDTNRLAPDNNVFINLGKTKRLTKNDEVVTFVNRNLEPTRGYHRFMRALPSLLKERPNASVIIIGGEGVSYGAKNKEGQSWKKKYIAEVRPKISAKDWQRVHFVGNLAYDDFVRVLQVSSVHVYLTYPFVLSWSLIEAMSIGCTIVASDTQPLHEVIRDNETGRLVNFFDADALVHQVTELLKDPLERQRLGANAREFAVANYDLRSVCLPKQLAWVEELAACKSQSLGEN